MKDYIVIASALNDQIRIHAANTTALVQQAVDHHHLLATSAAALGRTMTVNAIMASDLKDRQAKITCIFNGKGPIGTVLTQADGAGNVRGFVSDPSIYMVRQDDHLDVGGAIGTEGLLTVIKDLGLKEPFTGRVQIQSGEVGDDFAYYFAISEQIPSVVGVGVLVNPDGSIQAAGGLIYQLLPNASEEAIVKCEQVAKEMLPVSTLINQGKSLEEVIRSYFPDAKILEERSVQWHCDCSKEKFKEALGTLKKADLQEMIADDQGAEIHCQYCDQRYFFTTSELQQILEEQC